MSEPFCASRMGTSDMTDDEFWDAVYIKDEEVQAEIDEADYHQELMSEFDRLDDITDRVGGYYIMSAEGPVMRVQGPGGDACTVCGATDHCGYDLEGRPYHHAQPWFD